MQKKHLTNPEPICNFKKLIKLEREGNFLKLINNIYKISIATIILETGLKYGHFPQKSETRQEHPLSPIQHPTESPK